MKKLSHYKKRTGIGLLIFAALLIATTCTHETPQTSKYSDVLSDQELSKMEELGVDNTTKYTDLLFADKTNISEWAKTHDPDFHGVFGETKTKASSSDTNPLKQFISRMQSSAHQLTDRETMSQMYKQPNGLAYVYGSKDLDKARTLIKLYPNVVCGDPMFGLDCSGMIKYMAEKSGLKLTGEGTVDFIDTAVWNKAFKESANYKNLVMENKGEIPEYEMQAGDIIIYYKDRKGHMGMVLENGHEVLKIYNCLGGPDKSCSENNDLAHGPVISPKSNGVGFIGWLKSVFPNGYTVLRVSYKQEAPKIETYNPTNITHQSVVIKGVITNADKYSITQCYICYSTNPKPTTASPAKQIIVKSDGSFEGTIGGLKENTTYYICVFAKNVNAEAYGTEKQFKTSNKSSATTKPTISTSAVRQITATTAICGGQVLDEGTYSVTDRGLFFSTRNNPQETGDKFNIGSGLGSFEGKAVNLEPDTKYYYRAYATSQAGTSYGDIISFWTEDDDDNGGSNTIKTITPSDNCNTAPVMEPYTTYRVKINVGDYTLAGPIAGRSANGDLVRGFHLAFRTERNWNSTSNHQVYLTNVISIFDPVMGIKYDCSLDYLYQTDNGFQYIDKNGKGKNETSHTALWGSNYTSLNSDNIMHIRIYHFYGSETPTISFDIKVE